jgi:hypothetical protein
MAIETLMLSIHANIQNRLDGFLKNDSIPNMVFHGPSGSGKRTVVYNFIARLYGEDRELMSGYVMDVNCAHGKGIRFVRDELKFFCRTHVNVNGTGHIKTVILSNADDLTSDAQSALRRCIELFSASTRFMVIVEDKGKLLKPILSRFCDIYVPLPNVDGAETSLHEYRRIYTFGNAELSESKKRRAWIKRNVDSCQPSYVSLIELAGKMYERGYSGADLIDAVDRGSLTVPNRAKTLLDFDQARCHFRNERLLMLFMLNFLVIRSEIDLENVGFI